MVIADAAQRSHRFSGRSYAICLLRTSLQRPKATRSVPSASTFRKSNSSTSAGASRRRDGPTRRRSIDRSQGVQLAKLQELVRYWGTDYDWRKVEARLNALPQFMTTIDGARHPLHPRPLPSPKPCR